MVDLKHSQTTEMVSNPWRLMETKRVMNVEVAMEGTFCIDLGFSCTFAHCCENKCLYNMHMSCIMWQVGMLQALSFTNRQCSSVVCI